MHARHIASGMLSEQNSVDLVIPSAAPAKKSLDMKIPLSQNRHLLLGWWCKSILLALSKGGCQNTNNFA